MADAEALCRKVAEVVGDGGGIEEVLRALLGDRQPADAAQLREARTWSLGHEGVDGRWREVSRLLELCERTGLFRPVAHGTVER